VPAKDADKICVDGILLSYTPAFIDYLNVFKYFRLKKEEELSLGKSLAVVSATQCSHQYLF